MKTMTTLRSRVSTPGVLLVTFISSTIALTALADVTTCVPAPPGLVGWWAGESNANDSAGTNNGALYGGMSFASGEAGQAFKFNGGSGYVEMPASAGLDVGAGTGLTFECWIKPAALADAQPLVEWNSGANPGLHLWISQPPPYGSGSGSIYVNLIDTAGASHTLCTAAGILNTNSFQHVALSYDKASGMTSLYYNGALVALAWLGSFSPQTSVPLYLGKRISEAPFVAFDGLLDEVSLYNRALAAAEIQAIYNAGSAGKCSAGSAPSITTQPASQTVTAGSSVTFTATATGTPSPSYQWRWNGTNIAGATGTSLTLSNVQPAQAGNYTVLVTNAFGSITSSNALLTVCSLTNGLTAYYPFNHNANDASGNGNDGTVNGATLTADRFGSPDSAYRFNGTSWIQLPDTVEPPQPSGLTLSAWVLADSGPYDAGAWLIHLSSRTGEGGIALWNASSCGFWVKLQNSNPQGYYANDDTVITNVWTHLVAVYKQGQFVEFWVNGSLAESNAIPNYALFTDPAFPLNSSLGNYDYAPGPYNGFSGAMDDVRIYNRALSPVEVQALYQCEATPPDYPIITQQPQSRTVSAGSNVTFTVTASGRAPLGYQWRLNGTNITGATGTSLTLSNVQPALAGNYTIRVTNIYGSAVSSNAVLSVNQASGCATPPSGLVSWWRAEANGLDQVGGNNGVLLNGTGFEAGMVGQAFRFNASSNSYVEVADSPALRFTNALTIECWAKRLNTSEVHILVEKGGDYTGGHNDFELALNDTYSGGKHFGFSTGGGSRGCVVTPDTAWHHYAAVAVSGQTDPLLYIDGVPQTITIRSGAAKMNLSASTRPLHIGAQIDPQTGWYYYSSTMIDEPAIYSRALSAAEIQAIYQAGSAGKCTTGVAPTIIVPPASQAAVVGSSATFTVTAAGTPPFSYQWRFSGTNIAGATGTSLTLSNVQPAQAGSYAVLVTNAFGSITSSSALLTVNPLPSCVPPPSGLVSWWRAEANGLDQVGGNNGVLLNGAGFDVGMVGQAFRFIGNSNSYMEVPDSPTLRFTNALTIECWAKRLSTSEVHNLVEKGGDWTGGQTDFEIGLNDTDSGGAHFGFSFAGGWRGCGVTPDTAWHHYAAVAVSGQSDPILYVDGVPRTVAMRGGRATMNLTASTRPLHIGAQIDPHTGWYYYSSTMIDEPAIYGRALSASEIQAIYQAGSAGKCPPTPPANCVPPPSGLVGWWPGEGNANDVAGGNNGTVQGGATFAAGKVGQAFNVSPSGGIVVVPDSPSLQITNQLTVEAWVNARSFESVTGCAILSKISINSGNNGYQFILVGNTIQGLFNSPGTSWPSQRIISAPILSTGVWYHVAFTYDQSAMKLYCNGQPVATNVIGAHTIATSPSELRISGADNHGYFDGLIDEPAVYNRALSADEIAAIYSAGGAGKCPLGVIPSIITQPASQTVPAGSNVTFTATTTGTPPLSYQWRWNGTNIAGATGTSLTLSNIQPTQTGSYSVMVTNLVGSVISSNAMLTINSPAQCTPPPAGLVSWWTAEGNALDSAGTNSGTLMGGASYASGLVGRAFTLDGVNGYVKIPKSPSLDVGSQVTVEFWMKPDPANLMNTCCQGLVTSDFYHIELSSGTGTNVGVSFCISTDSGATYYQTAIAANGGGAAVTPGVWHHVAGTYDGTKLQLYIDGQPWGIPIVASGLISPMGPNSFVCIGSEEGRLVCQSCTANRFFKGQIDEAGIYNRALSAPAIAAIYNAGSAGKCGLPPSILTQPQSQVAAAGANITFTVAAAGTPPLSYQWRANGTNVVGATGTSLTLSNVQPARAGSYSVLVTNSVGSVISSNAVLTINSPVQCTPPPAGLVSWWAAEGNALDSADSNNGTLRDGATLSPGKVGQAFNFNPTSGTVVVPDSVSLRLTNQLTIEAWINARSYSGPGGYAIVSKLGFATGNNGYQFGLVGTTLLGLFNSPGQGWPSARIDSGSVITTGVWYHVAFSYDQSAMKLYCNGQPVATNGIGAHAIATSTSDLRISGADTQCYFDGLIDEPSVYNRALSATEIAAIYNAGSSGKCGFPPSILTQPQGQTATAGANAIFTVSASGTPPLSYRWQLNSAPLAGATGTSLVLTNLQDSQAGHYRVVVSNPFGSATSSNAVLTVLPAPLCATPPAGLVSWWAAEGNALDSAGSNNGVLQGGATLSPGKVGQAFNFDPASGTVVAPDSASLRLTNQLTIEAWINARTLSGPGGYAIVSKLGIATGNNGYQFGLVGTTLQGLFNSPGVGWPSATISSGSIIATGLWYHVAYTYDQSAMKLYCNGQPVATNVIGAHAIATSTSDLRISGADTHCYFDGLIDEPAVYSRALSAAEITAIYNAGSSGKCKTSPTLLNVNFAAYTQVKVGFAGTGQTATDFWNNYTAPFQSLASLSNLTMADGTPTTVGLTVQNGAGHWAFTHPDLMYNCYCYSQNHGDITVTVTNLPSGQYDFYLYGHAAAATANTVFQVLVGGTNYGNRPTSTSSAAALTNFVEGAQYVVYRNVGVTNGGAPVTIKAHPGSTGDAQLNGMQISLAAAGAQAQAQPAQVAVVVPSGSVGAAMQLEVRGAPGRVYAIQASSNVTDWVTIGLCVTDTDGSVRFIDPDADKYPTRLYRVVGR